MPSAATRSALLLTTACALLTACASTPLATPSAMLPPHSAPLSPERADPVIAAWSSSSARDNASYAEAIKRELTGLAKPRSFDGPPSPRYLSNGGYIVFVWSDGTIAYSDTRDFSWDPLRTAHVDPSEVERATIAMRRVGLTQPYDSGRYEPAVPCGSSWGIGAFESTEAVARPGIELDVIDTSHDEASRRREVAHRAMLVLDELISKAMTSEQTMHRDTLPSPYELSNRLHLNKTQ